MSIKAVIFDLGQVIFKFDLSKFINQFLKKTPQKESTDVNKIILEFSKTACLYETGKISSLEFFNNLAEKTQYSGSFNEFSVIWNNIFKLNEETLEIIAALRKENYHLAILSNTNELHFEFLKEMYPGVFALFDKIFLSHEMKERKPDDAIYQKVIEYYGGEPSSLFFIDDLEENIQAAKRNGITAYIFTTALELRNNLKTEGVII
ncbi:MAG: HAD family phosphatase [Endomicrobia bacterium]|nr:HAD family phosphatase [Endomicrobiia bacterium]MCL2506627.1 HAD family phosphatase [Endomicrobiia bacterium]